MDKTTVMKMLDKKGVKYNAYTYGNGEAMSGVDVAKLLGQDENQVFKTLVTTSKSGKNYVFVIPSPCELDLKKAAKAVGEKNVEMLKSKDLLPLTGYVHGGCSPIGMKKFFTTTIDKSAENFDTIIFSAGKIGYQVEMSLADLSRMIRFATNDLTV